MSKIKELLNDKDSVLVFDVDGVLAVMEWGEYTHYDKIDEDWVQMYKSDSYFYTEKFASKQMQDFLKNKDMSRVYVISKVMVEQEIEDKKRFLEKNYNIDRSHVFAVKDNNKKVDILKNIKEKYPELDDHFIIMIEDTVEVLTDVMLKTNFSTAHISSFLK